jgi:CHAT domain-containing protein
VHPDPQLLAAWGTEPLESAAAQIQDWASSPWDGRYAAVPGRGRLYEIIYAEANAKERFLEYSEAGTLWGRYRDDRLVKLAELWRAGDLLVDDSLSGCRIAFLSACEAGGGALSAREVDEGMGLPAALHLAGVSTVICSLWPVSDVFTALYVDLFYAAFARAGTRIDVADLVRTIGEQMRDMTRTDASARLKALRGRTSDARARFRLEAASAAIARGDEHPFSHPIDWAAFFVLGTPVVNVEEQQ